MNRTTKERYDFAKRMLKGSIEVSEVVMMTGLSEEEVLKLKEEVVPNHPAGLDNLDFKDFDLGPILVDNNEIDEDIDKNY